MERTINGLNSQERGIQIHGTTPKAIDAAKKSFLNRLKAIGIEQFVSTFELTGSSKGVRFQVDEVHANDFAPGGDTAQIYLKLNLDTYTNPLDLEREIVLAMLMCPVPFDFPNYDELSSAIHIRRNIVQFARKTSLAFATDEAERPAEYWSYDDDRGFILRPGKSLIEALQHATQPELSGQRYTFSCRRAAEYIVLLSIASEVLNCNTKLFNDLQLQAETRAIKGREFERIFHRQIGSLQQPLPLKFFVPGDRTWFRNPDKDSAEVVGYEGSWTFYLGSGIFADFWRPNEVYNLTTKCLSIYHWRNSTYKDANGELQIDEQRVENQVEKTLEDTAETEAILQEMIRLQLPLDTVGGGCIEAHREYVRQVCQGTADLNLPDIATPNEQTVLTNMMSN